DLDRCPWLWLEYERRRVIFEFQPQPRAAIQVLDVKRRGYVIRRVDMEFYRSVRVLLLADDRGNVLRLALAKIFGSDRLAAILADHRRRRSIGRLVHEPAVLADVG